MPKPIFLLCPACQGTGQSNGEKCHKCERSPVYLWLDGQVFYWGRKINEIAITRRKARHLFNFGVNLALLIFGLTGAGFLIFSLLSSLRAQDITPLLILKNIIFKQDRPHFIFWLSMVGDIFLGYRLNREAEKDQKVIINSFSPEETPPPRDLSYNSIFSLPAEKIIEISPSFDNLAHKTLEESWALAYRLAHQQVRPIHLLATILTAK